MSNIIYLDHKSYWDFYTEHQLTQIEEWLQEYSIYDSMKDFRLARIRVDWSTRRRYSRGGWYPAYRGAGVSLAMWPVCGRKDPKDRVPMKVFEYASFQNDSEIGNFYTDDLHHRLLMIICHEMGHAAQYFHKRHHGMTQIKPHGKEFKMFYREIRNHWLNPNLPDQKEMGEKYREHKKMSIRQEWAA